MIGFDMSRCDLTQQCIDRACIAERDVHVEGGEDLCPEFLLRSDDASVDGDDKPARRIVLEENI